MMGWREGREEREQGRGSGRREARDGEEAK
jgi:hypothetical protein